MWKNSRVLWAMPALFLLSSGCSMMSAVGIGKNVMRKDSHLVVYVDGMEAKQNKLKKGAMGYADFKVEGTCSTSPSFKYEFADDENFGRLKSTNLAIYQAFENSYSNQTEFNIYPAGGGNRVLEQGKTYNLSSTPAGFECQNYDGNVVNGVTLKPGMDYMMLFTLSGDRADTIKVLFSTK